MFIIAVSNFVWLVLCIVYLCYYFRIYLTLKTFYIFLREGDSCLGIMDLWVTYTGETTTMKSVKNSDSSVRARNVGS